MIILFVNTGVCNKYQFSRYLYGANDDFRAILVNKLGTFMFI